MLAPINGFDPVVISSEASSFNLGAVLEGKACGVRVGIAHDNAATVCAGRKGNGYSRTRLSLFSTLYFGYLRLHRNRLQISCHNNEETRRVTSAEVAGNAVKDVAV